MLITVMQILDTSITNVALPHMQGSLSTSVEETSWVITSYLAANAIIIPATGWIMASIGRRRLFLICTMLFTVSSFLSGLAPNLESLVAMRVLQGLAAVRWSRWPRRRCGRSFRCASAGSRWGCGAWAS
jgi:DHA2 family multidrug resistance protein